MPVWRVFSFDADGKLFLSASHVGSKTSALNRALSLAVRYGHLLVQQMALPFRIKGTDGLDALGNNPAEKLPLPPEQQNEDDGTTLNHSIIDWLEDRALKTDKGYKRERVPGDARCRCSRCRQVIAYGSTMIGCQFISDGKACYLRYHSECIGVRFTY